MVTVASRFLRYIPEAPMVGPDVRLVQERLRVQGFYPGTLDGVFGRGTNDAIIAFQARRQLTPDGVVGPSTYAALGQGPVPQALGDKGPSITIDTERRRLYLRRGGALQRIYDVAVGSPESPTPVGKWVVVEKSANPGGPFGARWMRLSIPWGGYPHDRNP
ncbi:MAG TPA: L,D-transpeptidase family protein [Symbiobacteriaceae bacterium]